MLNVCLNSKMRVSLHVFQQRNSKKYFICFVHQFTLHSCKVVSHKIIYNAVWCMHWRTFENQSYCACAQHHAIRKPVNWSANLSWNFNVYKYLMLSMGLFCFTCIRCASKVHLTGAVWTLLQVSIPHSIWPLSEVIIRTIYTGLFKMTVGVLTTCHTQYTWDRSM
jgi:hypothetical protein